jgi:hypothetical protein
MPKALTPKARKLETTKRYISRRGAENAENKENIGTQMNTDLLDQKKKNPRLSVQIRVRFLCSLCACAGSA